MKPSGGLYFGEEQRIYLDIYNYNPDVHIMLPPDIRKITKYVEHFSYKKGVNLLIK